MGDRSIPQQPGLDDRYSVLLAVSWETRVKELGFLSQGFDFGVLSAGSGFGVSGFSVES